MATELLLYEAVAQEIGKPSAPPSSEDLVLFNSMAAGDVAALETLYNRYSPMVFALCARVVGDKTEAEDVLIDVFSQIWTRRTQFDPARGAPLTYILTIARSRALDRRRSRRGRPVLDDAAAASSAAGAPSDGPVGRLLAGEDALRVRAALAQLDEGPRRAIELSFLEGLTHAQIAEKLDRPLGTIKTIIRQGLIRLRELVRIPGRDAPDAHDM
ncbi:MAG TPA: sigma-70 family RNA polymerase sigma factor [Tepidisphaeraceae bacterium]|nr:sigma-70 family RNA polymerase sigma factor [Tepidisphaeraceae bacterium]